MSRRDRPVAVPSRRTASVPADVTSGRRAPVRSRAPRGAAVLASVLLGVAGPACAAAAAPAASPSATADDLQVRRTGPAADGAVELAVLPAPGRVGDGTATVVRKVEVAQAGRRLPTDTAPLVSGAHPLALVVLVEPASLPEAQALVADALSALPEGVSVSLAPVAASAGAAPSTGAVLPSDALAGLDRLTAASAVPSPAPGSTAAGASRATLLMTTCPGGGRVPDVGAGAATWVLSWGAGCRAGVAARTNGPVVVEADSAAQARAQAPDLVGDILAARSVRVTPRGTQPLVVTASGERRTVPLAVAPVRGRTGAAAGALAAPEDTDRGGLSSWLTAARPWGYGASAVCVLAGALLLVRSRRRTPALALESPTADDPWSRLVPDWTRPGDGSPERDRREGSEASA